jgi:hypothetical protein
MIDVIHYLSGESMIRTVVRMAGVLVTLTTGSLHAQDTTFIKALRANVSPFTIANGRMTGAGADALARAARENQFILVGEDHGIRELPEFVSALFAAARPADYRHLGVEIGPITGRRLETTMRAPDSQREIDTFLGKYTPFTLPFFFWKEEAQMLESIVKSVPGTRGVVWGLDQEFIMSPTYMFERLAAIAQSPAAKALATQLAEASAKGDQAMIRTGNPGAVWMVTSNDADVAKLQSTFAAKKGSEAEEIIRELSVSREIYRMFNSGTNYESNQKRDDLMKHHFIDAYNTAKARGEAMPKAIIKLGANHVFRGPSTTDSYEMGSFIPEFVETTGGKSFGILVVVAKGTWNAYRPFGSDESDKTQKYDPLTTSEYAVFDIKSLLDAASPTDWTFFDLRPIRAGVADARIKGLNPKARRLLTSFDAVVVVPEGHASVYFR